MPGPENSDTGLTVQRLLQLGTCSSIGWFALSVCRGVRILCLFQHPLVNWPAAALAGPYQSRCYRLIEILASMANSLASREIYLVLYSLLFTANRFQHAVLLALVTDL